MESVFIELCSLYTSDHRLVADLWEELQKAYGQKKRHYHTLAHLENMYRELIACRELIEDLETILFSLYYHDIVYKASRNDNEEQSAEVAAQRMRSIGVPEEKIAKCRKQILATKAHQPGEDNDTDLFTDADLSILGAGRDTYEQYSRNVRKEYSIYPDLLYNPGRRKVLEHFLEMDKIFKTVFFYDKLEKQARINLSGELELLGS